MGKTGNVVKHDQDYGWESPFPGAAADSTTAAAKELSPTVASSIDRDRSVGQSMRKYGIAALIGFALLTAAAAYRVNLGEMSYLGVAIPAGILSVGGGVAAAMGQNRINSANHREKRVENES